MTDVLGKLQEWYLTQCNDDWEHQYGIKIGTLDNPGWTLDIDLTDTALSGKSFEPKHYGMFEHAATSGNEWIHCNVENNVFIGRGGPQKLGELINAFLDWAAENA